MPKKPRIVLPERITTRHSAEELATRIDQALLPREKQHALLSTAISRTHTDSAKEPLFRSLMELKRFKRDPPKDLFRARQKSRQKRFDTHLALVQVSIERAVSQKRLVAAGKLLDDLQSRVSLPVHFSKISWLWRNFFWSGLTADLSRTNPLLRHGLKQAVCCAEKANRFRLADEILEKANSNFVRFNSDFEAWMKKETLSNAIANDPFHAAAMIRAHEPLAVIRRDFSALSGLWKEIGYAIGKGEWPVQQGQRNHWLRVAWAHAYDCARRSRDPKKVRDVRLHAREFGIEF